MSRRSRKRTKQDWAQHVRQAQAQGLSLAQYCRERRLSVQSLYSARHELSKRAKRSNAPQKQGKSARSFVEVQIAPAEPGFAACRVRVKGGVIECATLPPSSWLRSLMSGDADAVS